MSTLGTIHTYADENGEEVNSRPPRLARSHSVPIVIPKVTQKKKDELLEQLSNQQMKTLKNMR